MKPYITHNITYNIYMAKVKQKDFFWKPYGYTKRDFQKWGKEGGSVFKYKSPAERQKAYRRRKAQLKLYANKQGILSMTTGRISKYRTNAEKQRAYRLRKN
jgi:hypothetical protein